MSHTALVTQRPNMEGSKEDTYTGQQRTYWIIQKWRQKIWWINAASLVTQKPLAWDVTVPDTYAASHIQATANSAGAAAESAAVNKTIKYNDLMTTHISVPIAVETSGAWCNQSAQFIEDLGRWINAITNDPLETTYLFQRLSVALQRGNAVAFSNTFPEF